MQLKKMPAWKAVAAALLRDAEYANGEEFKIREHMRSSITPRTLDRALRSLRAAGLLDRPDSRAVLLRTRFTPRGSYLSGWSLPDPDLEGGPEVPLHERVVEMMMEFTHYDRSEVVPYLGGYRSVSKPTTWIELPPGPDSAPDGVVLAIPEVHWLDVRPRRGARRWVPERVELHLVGPAGAAAREPKAGSREYGPMPKLFHLANRVNCNIICNCPRVELLEVRIRRCGAARRRPHLATLEYLLK